MDNEAMSCLEIIFAILDIAISAGVGIWIATAIAKGHTEERFLKDYFTQELITIKEECKTFFDEICYDKSNANSIKIGFKLLSMRITALEANLDKAFKNAHPTLSTSIQKIQLEITGSEEFNDQYKETVVKFSPSVKNTILEQRSKLLTEFSEAVIVINKAAIDNSAKSKKRNKTSSK